MYSANNLLASYSNTSKTIQVLLPNGKVSFTFIVCNYQKASVTNNFLNIIFSGSIKNYILEFSSNAEAKQALSIITQAIDLLKLNCGGSGGSVVIPDATATVKGIIQLSGDLSGTASAPTVPVLSNKVDKTTNLTINGIQQDLSTDRSWTISSTNNSNSINQLLSGGIVSWSGQGLIFDVTSAIYSIDNVQYNFNGGSSDLSPADATNPRFDTLALDNTGVLIKISGTPGINPEIPQVDPATQLYLTSIYIAAGTTTPTTITQSLIYNENTEWIGSVNGFTANFDDTTAPFEGLKDINISAGTNGGFLTLSNTSILNVTDYSLLKFYIRLQASMPKASNIVLSFYNGNTKVSNSLILSSSFNFSKSTVGTYQNISINLTDFAFTQASFDKLRITYTGNTFVGFYLDYIQLQGVPGSTTIVNVQDATITSKGIVQLAGDLAGTAAAPTVPGLATLQTNINSEASTRASADTTLQNNIDLKLDISAYNDHYKGKYATLAALQSAYPTANAGDYAQVDAGAGSDVINYNYDVEDGWIIGGSGSGATNTDQLPEGSTNLYFTNARAIAAVDISGKVDKNTAITGATKTKITYDAKGLVTAGVDATTADINDSIDKRYVTDAELVVIGNTSGINSGDQMLPVKASSAEINTGSDDAKFATALGMANSKYTDQSGSKISAVASGTDTYTATITPAITTYAATQRFFIKFTNANTGAATLNLNSIGAIAIKKSATTDLALGDIVAGQILCLAYDGTNFQIVGGVGTVVKQTYTSGTTVTANNTTTLLIINPTSIQSTLTITLAATPSDGQKIEISFGGTITSGNGVVTVLTLAANTGQTLIQSTTPSYVQAGDAISYKYNSTNTSWYRIN